MSDPLHGPWKGESKILLSIDIGITHSGVSFMYLKNGAKQTIYPVTKWPGQEGVSIDSMVPTMLWYDTNNKAVSFGAEALSYAVEEQAKDKGWFLAKNFKAHLYPEDTRAQHHPKISALPFDVSLRQVYSDFLGYLLKHTKIFFEERIIDGVQIWETYSSTMEVLMSHPDGWGAREQSFLRDVAVRAGYTTSDRALKNIRFIIDLEASVYRCLSSNNLSNQLKAGDVFILCDADTTSTSISLHKIRSINPMLKIETCTLECLEGGSFSIDVVAERYMRQKMIDAGISPEDMDDFITAGVEDFKKNVKFAFSDETREYLIQITNARFNNPALSTRRGRMALPGSIVKSFFVDYVGLIRQTIDRCVGEVGTSILHLLLVGRFGDSCYLQQVIKDVYEPRGYQISLPTNSA
ncbi:unnamed protein product [Rhizoctonia solani]|uniref:Uncharacterized protein n=1 Tax=Rhizoctonia solani TaxID=456999 RepID=A0A8H3HDS2_9AGAM|nr:unnamed protein product [Rhizoctonia solani]